MIVITQNKKIFITEGIENNFSLGENNSSLRINVIKMMNKGQVNTHLKYAVLSYEC